MSRAVATALGGATPLLSMRGIYKEFHGVRALDGVDFTLRRGEIHALCGENGAGKSTLMKILSGVYGADDYAGAVLIDGVKQTFRRIRDSEKAGIAIIHQELSLVPEMTIGENIFIGREPSYVGVIRWQDLYARAKILLDEIGLKRNPRRKVKFLGVGEQQLVEIAKALSQGPRILVLDEPTSALSKTEVDIFLRVIVNLRARGVSCVLISHKLDEVLAVADRITVLRDGQTVDVMERAAATQDRIVASMVGRALGEFFPPRAIAKGPKVFEVEHLTVAHPERPGKFILNDVGFKVRRGEILGVAGLMGAGRTETLLSIFGVYPGPVETPPRVKVGDKIVRIGSPAQAIALGLALVPEDRKNLGLLLNESVVKNMTLSSLAPLSSWGVIDRGKERSGALAMMRSLKIKAGSMATAVHALSGGNQQKVVLGKCLMTQPRVLFLDEPTRGIDVGAKAEIYKLMNELAADGLAVVMVSSELPELLGMSDRILVMSRGRITGEFDAGSATQEKLMAAATL